MAAKQLFRYQARLDRVVDGDTMDMTVDLGFGTRKTIRVRLRDVDTAEIYGVRKESDEYQAGMEHKQFVENWFDEANADHGGYWPLIVDTYSDETGKYGRYLARIFKKSHDSTDAADAMLNQAIMNEYPDATSL